MMSAPSYFEGIRERAAARWDQLESDPELAGPWHQLFRQVQSPRHILSELLQNADDAGATEAAVRIEDGYFVFSHNGEDFTEEHFASLCRFGYSNKRALHTIGFRGIGFKSTFSLGGTVELHTRTLSVSFNSRRFTEPRWIEAVSDLNGSTMVRVTIGDSHREREVSKNLDEWLASPISLLFFKNIRRMTIGGREVHWESLGPGPAAGSEWMGLKEHPDKPYLLIRSAAEAFPEEALAEIRQERMLNAESDTDFPPCRIEIVLGTTGRLYVVLPTGVGTELPFGCNAPFIQDPARLKIKDPETSPTNRWLLERAGRLAASAMLEWLAKLDADVADRSRAYALMPDVDRESNSLEGVSAATVELAFESEVEGRAVLLTEAGTLEPAQQAIIVPKELFEIWDIEQVAALLDPRSRPPLARDVSSANRNKLINWRLVDRIDKKHVLSALQEQHLPKPEGWQGLLKLWAYVASELTGWPRHADPELIRIMPVQGQGVLYSAMEIVRLGARKLLQSDEDWVFLEAHLLVLDHEWIQLLSNQSKNEGRAQEVERDFAAALSVLKTTGLHAATDVSSVVEQVAKGFFSGDSLQLSDCVRLAQIAAKLGATAGGSFRFATGSRKLRGTGSGVVFDPDGSLAVLLPEAWCSANLLHSEYSGPFVSCSPQEWLQWASSERSGLLGFAPLLRNPVEVYNRDRIAAALRERDCEDCAVDSKYWKAVLYDWDFDTSLWEHWNALSSENPKVWWEVLQRILAQPPRFSSDARAVHGSLIPRDGRRRSGYIPPCLPRWVLKFRNLACLPDTRQFLHTPGELLCRSPQTEAFMDVELFVDARVDTEANRRLLQLLGVRNTPTGPGRLLDCLRALSKADQPPVHEVDKWYRRLDQLVETASTADSAKIRSAFRDEKLILSDEGSWISSTGVFLSSGEEDAPDVALVRASVRDLALWRQIGVAERPTVALSIQWLKSLPAGKTLAADELRRVRALIARHAVQVWSECRHWLNLSNQWVPTEGLRYALTKQSFVAWSHLHEWVKQATADLQRLPAEVVVAPPFSGLSLLSSCIEERFESAPHSVGRPERRAWLNQLGTTLCRFEIEDDNEMVRVRGLAAELAETKWLSSSGLELVPYIDGKPAGTPRRAEVLWHERVLYVENRPLARLARTVPQELVRAFRRPEIADAIKICFDRSPEFVIEYLEENLKLAPREAVGPRDNQPTANDGTVPNDTEVSEPSSPVEAETGSETPARGGERAGDPHGEDLVDIGDEDTTFEGEDEDSGDEDATREDESQVSKPRTQPKPPKPSIMARFAHSQGFRNDGKDRFFHSDGSWIAKESGTLFPWQRRTGAGELVRYYLPKDHCIEREPLQLDADVWGLIEKFPTMYSLVLADPRDDAIEVSGARLLAMRETGEVVLYPATYRLVYEQSINRA